MKTPPDTPEFARFNDALRQVMKVSKTDLNAMLRNQDALASVKQPKGPRPKTVASARASSQGD